MTTLTNLLDSDGENQAVRMFLAAYGAPGLTVAAMRQHLKLAGWDHAPAWATRDEAQGHLTKGGAQDWLRHLFALETPYVRMPPLSEADQYDCEREQLALGNLTDRELSYGAFVNTDRPEEVSVFAAGAHYAPAIWIAAMRDRVRWLSRTLERL